MKKKLPLITLALVLSACSGQPRIVDDIDDFDLSKTKGFTLYDNKKTKEKKLENTQRSPNIQSNYPTSTYRKVDGALSFEAWKEAKEANSQEYQEYLEYREYLQTLQVQ